MAAPEPVGQAGEGRHHASNSAGTPSASPGLGEPLVEREHGGAMLRCDGKMQRVTGAIPTDPEMT